MSEIEDRLKSLELALPAPPAAPPGVRLPFAFVRVHGELAYVSGHGPLDGDRVLATGRVPTEVSVEQAYEAARATALSMLASLQRELGNLDRVTGWVLGRAGKDDALRIERAIDDAIDVLPLAVAGDFNEAMKRLHTSRP